MTTRTFPSTTRRWASTLPRHHYLAVRLVAGLPLLGIGLAHVFSAEAPMKPLVEAADIPFAAVVAPAAVAAEIVAGAALLLGLFARPGALLAAAVMVGAVYAHLVIDVWPNGPDREPPLILPIAVLVAALYIAARGAGPLSLDHWRSRR